jgi:transketolase
MDIKQLQDIANLLRRDSLKMTSKAGSGHPSSCLSAADIVSCLFFNEMSFDVKNSANDDNDEFVLSKGHASALLYSALYYSGCIKEKLEDYRKITSNLEGHPTPELNWIKVASGSLGQGLSVGVGMALAGKLRGRKFRTYVLLGDSELAEGSNYEALQLAAHYNLDNLCAIIDVNRLGQRGETMQGWNTKLLAIRLASFGWDTIVVNGHNIKQILDAFEKARKSKKPAAIIAKTVKGKGVSFLEDKNGWHGKALSEKELAMALKMIPDSRIPNIEIKSPLKVNPQEPKEHKITSNNYKLGEEIATREAYGNALANLAKANGNILALDGEVSNSTFSEKVKQVNEKQFIECFIAEQNMIGMALGLSKKGFNVFSSSFAAFLSRAYDQLRMAAISKADFTVCGSHAGISIGEDGASQMGLEDIAMFRSLPNSIVFYPSDALSTEKIVNLCSELKGIKYLRTTRPKTPVLYDNKEDFEVGGFKVLKQSNKDKVVLIGSGITLHESLKAQEELKKHKIDAAVIDLYCIKPINSRKLEQFIKSHGNKLIITEDHHFEGGIGEALLSALNGSGITINHLAVSVVPHSGRKDELLDKYGINAKAIVNEAKRII